MSISTQAAQHNGVCTWGFSQANFSTWKHYRTSGICAALSAHWIKYHADDDSLANHLGSGGMGNLVVTKLKEIAKDHKDMSKKGAEQKDNIERWLHNHGIRTLHKNLVKSFPINRNGETKMTSKASSYAKEEMETGGCPNIENDIVNALKKFNTCYVRVNFGSKKTAHAIAVWLGQPTYNSPGDACMFDPNHGEYWFQNKQDFFQFFPGYYRSAYRKKLVNFSHEWEVIPCAKAIF